jgi:hypothetical protein
MVNYREVVSKERLASHFSFRDFRSGISDSKMNTKEMSAINNQPILTIQPFNNQSFNELLS